MRDQEDANQVWLPVIGRALAFVCMHQAEIAGKTLAEKASFLEGLGLERRDVANMLGTTYASITQTLSNLKLSRKAKGNYAKKQRRPNRKK